MSLDLGTLQGFISLDDSSFDGVLDRMPDKLKGSGMILAGVAGVVAAGIGATLSQALESAVNTEAATDKVAAGLGLTEEQAAVAGASAGKLYADAYGDSIEGVSDSVGIVMSSFDGMKNANADTVADITAKLLNVETALGVDVSRAAQVAGQAVKNGLAKDPNEAIDLLVKNLQAVPEALRGDLLDAVDEYGPILSNMGFSGEEAFGMLANAADKGMYGIDKTGDALKEFSIRATDMSSASGAAYETLGMDQEAATNRLLAGGDSARQMFEEIVAGISGIQDPAAQSQAALALFGTPLEDLGTAEIPEFLDQLVQVKDGFGETAGAADAMGETLNGNNKTAWLGIQRQWEGIVGTLGQQLLPIITEVTDFMAENPEVIMALVAILGILGLAFIAVSIATWAMNTALLANPITWIVLAIVALIAALVLLFMNWDLVVAWVTEIWAGFIGWLTEVINGLATWWNETWAAISQFFIDLWNGLVALVVGIIMGYVTFWYSIWAAIIGFFIGLWTGAVNFFVGIITGMISTGVSVVSGFIGWWNGAWSAVGQFFTNLWAGLISGVQSAWAGIIGFFQGIPSTILGFFAGIGSWLYSAGSDLVNGLLDGIRSMAGQIGSFFLSILPDWIVGPFKAALGIASPSKLFREFGGNIGQGLLLGLDDEQSAIDRRVAGLVDVPGGPADGSAGGRGASGGSSSSTSVEAPFTIHGDVHVTSLDELDRERTQRQRDALALAGVTIVEVA